MALLQIHTTAHSITTTLSPILSFHSSRPPPPPLHLSLPHSLKSHHKNSLFSSTKTTPFSLSRHPTRLLCQPAQGTHVRENYLVVCVPHKLSLTLSLPIISCCVLVNLLLFCGFSMISLKMLEKARKVKEF